MVEVFLKKNEGYKWFSNETISIKGSFFDNENNYYEKENLISFFTNIDNENKFLKRIKEINGIFSVIIKLKNKTLIASDTTRIFPLFYTFKHSYLYISDDITLLKEKFNITEIDESLSNEFLASGYTLGNKTLLKNVYQTQSNGYLVFHKNKIKQGFFYSYTTNRYLESSYSILKNKAINVIDNTFERFVKSLNNQTVVLPLSGGFDSRLIAVMLKKFNYMNVICFTYGKSTSFEIENSKKTAEILNYKWIFVNYSNDIVKNYINTQIFKNYAIYAGKFSSMPFLQEYFAVKYLKEKKLIPKDSIFSPGLLIDFLSGSQLIKVLPKDLKISKVSKLILKKRFIYSNLPNKSKKEILKNVEGLLYNYDPCFKTKFPHSVFENYELKEKVSKFIFNSSNVYSFFDYEYRFPFSDKELISFFRDVPLKYKLNKLLYKEILKSHYFKNYNLNFTNELQPSLTKIYIQNIKNYIKPFLPYFLTKLFLKKNDWLNYNLITKEIKSSLLINNLKFNSKVKSYNELIIQWYIYFSKGLIK